MKNGQFLFVSDSGSEEEIKTSSRSLRFLKSTSSYTQPQPPAMNIIDFPTFKEAGISGYTRVNLNIIFKMDWKLYL